MRETEFREWLEDNGANTAAGRNTRLHAVRTIEKKLAELGFDYGDLDVAWSADRFADLRDALALLREDFSKGGEKFRILMPQSDKPKSRLASWRSWLGQYGQFLDGQTSRSDADKIRRFVLETYIEAARESNLDTADIVVKDVDDALELKEAWPNICQALRGKKFQEIADVPPPQSFGADMSTATRFRFNVDKMDYWALAILTSRYGDPISQTKKMASFELNDGRQIAIDLEAARPQLWLEGQIRNNDEQGFDVKSYVADAPRHSNLPPRLRHGQHEAQSVSLVTFPNGEILQKVLRQYESGDRILDLLALDRLKDRFLSVFPNFDQSGGFAGRSRYHDQEDDYKRALIKATLGALDKYRDDKNALGGRILDLLSNESELESNLLGWRMAAHLKKCREAHPGVLETAAGAMVLSSNTKEGVIDFVEASWPILSAAQKSKPYGDSRTIPTLLAALAKPEQIIGLRTDRFRNLFEALFGEKLFDWAPLSRPELDRTTALAEQLFAIMRDDWEWQPRDLWDVQGFIWVTCATKLTDDASELTNRELLEKFDGDEAFQRHRMNWSAEQTGAFCSVARIVHDAGLDWYFTNIPQIRFGRKELGDPGASGTLGSIQFRAARAFLEFSHQNDKIGIEGQYQFDAEGAKSFASDFEDVEEQIASWEPAASKRAGLWPDEYNMEKVKMTTGNLHIEPTNLILYGPPGTGKTFKTMEVAVKQCGEIPAKDRKDLRAQYEELKRAKRIAFVTFHQNYDYESFVEGLRPETSEIDEESASGAGFRLEPRSGIFREFCALAEQAQSYPKSQSAGSNFDFTGKTFWKMGLGVIGTQDDVYDDALEKNHIALGYGGTIDWSDARFHELEAIKQEWLKNNEDDRRPSNWTQIWPLRSVMQIGDLVIVPYGNTAFRAIGEVIGDYRYDPTAEGYYAQQRDVRWLLTLDEPLPLDTIVDGKFTMRTLYPIPEKRVNKEALGRLIGSKSDNSQAESGVSSSPDQFVLIIDEINRANVSKVFGELITLIEPDKRLGMDEELRIQLPYSRKSFGVPANLHIIGTMNTADRSVMQIDTALRRRFRFEEMEPDSSLLRIVDGINLGRVLDAINARIEYLLDRDHAVGHAFFMGDGGKDRAAIDDTMRFKIIPLLQEYFFDDWRNIAAVLGPGFVSGKTLPVPLGIEDRGDSRARWTIRWQENGNAGFPTNAYDLLLKGSQAEVDRPENGEIEAIGGYPEEA